MNPLIFCTCTREGKEPCCTRPTRQLKRRLFLTLSLDKNIPVNEINALTRAWTRFYSFVVTRLEFHVFDSQFIKVNLHLFEVDNASCHLTRRRTEKRVNLLVVFAYALSLTLPVSCRMQARKQPKVLKFSFTSPFIILILSSSDSSSYQSVIFFTLLLSIN